MIVGIAMLSVVVCVVQDTFLTKSVVVGRTVTVIVLRPSLYKVVVGAVPAMLVVVALTGAAVIMTVTVDVGTGLPMQEQAVARLPFDKDPRASRASAASQVETSGAASSAAPEAAGEIYVVKVASSVLCTICVDVTVTVGPLSTC